MKTTVCAVWMLLTAEQNQIEDM